MPFYEYQCQACGEQLEVLQKISDPLLVDCPACEKPGLKKKVSAAAFRLKGGGWYETDFKDKNKRNVAESGQGGNGKDKASGGDSGKSADTPGKNSSTGKAESKKPSPAASSSKSSD